MTRYVPVITLRNPPGWAVRTDLFLVGTLDRERPLVLGLDLDLDLDLERILERSMVVNEGAVEFEPELDRE
jgi:hypothetical protein